MNITNELNGFPTSKGFNEFTFKPFIKLETIGSFCYFGIYNSKGIAIGFTPKFLKEDRLNVFRLIRIQLDVILQSKTIEARNEIETLHNLILLLEMDYSNKKRNRDISKREMTDYRLDDLLDRLIELGLV